MRAVLAAMLLFSMLVQPAVAIDEQPPNPPPLYGCKAWGDFNYNRIIDFWDRAELESAIAWVKVFGGYWQKYDLNRDWQINELDLAVLNLHYGEQCEVDEPEEPTPVLLPVKVKPQNRVKVWGIPLGG